MSRISRITRRLSEAWRDGGIRGVVSTVSSYLAWKSGGSPRDIAGLSDTDRTERMESAINVMLMRDWYARAEPSSSPLVSIILPTRDRQELLQRAVASVLAQSYHNWELLIVDDSESGVIPMWLEELKDLRIRWMTTGGKGVGAARNLGIEQAEGEIVAFLDDDNLMDPIWTKALVLSFEAHPEANVVIGAQMVMPEPGQSAQPKFRFPSVFDWETLTQYNFVDMGMVAHRVDSDLRFDETLPAFVDWDYVVKLTFGESPVLTPALSGTYATDAAGRLSYQDRRDLQQSLQVRFRALGSRSSQSTNGQSPSGISDDDLSAIEWLLDRKASGSKHAVEILEIGTHQVSRALVGRSRKPQSFNWAFLLGNADAENPPAQRFDLVFLETDAPPSGALPLERIVSIDGLVVGLNAHRIDYQANYPGFRSQRRLGDSLWVGFSDQIDLEKLFPGSALTKLGFDDESRATPTYTQEREIQDPRPQPSA